MVIDSHALLWWLEGDRRLPPVVRERLDRAGDGEEAYCVASVTFWELRMKELRGQIEPTRPIREWPRILGKLGWLTQVDTTSAIWMLSAELDWGHGDPADRMIAATAIIRGTGVLSKDRRFHADDSPVEAVWS